MVIDRSAFVDDISLKFEDISHDNEELAELIGVKPEEIQAIMDGESELPMHELTRINNRTDVLLIEIKQGKRKGVEKKVEQKTDLYIPPPPEKVEFAPTFMDQYSWQAVKTRQEVEWEDRRALGKLIMDKFQNFLKGNEHHLVEVIGHRAFHYCRIRNKSYKEVPLDVLKSIYENLSRSDIQQRILNLRAAEDQKKKEVLKTRADLIDQIRSRIRGLHMPLGAISDFWHVSNSTVENFMNGDHNGIRDETISLISRCLALRPTRTDYMTARLEGANLQTAERVASFLACRDLYGRVNVFEANAAKELCIPVSFFSALRRGVIRNASEKHKALFLKGPSTHPHLFK